jgi:succinyl-diaminopimelate desuccinylase
VSLQDDLVWLVGIPSPTGAEERLRDAISDRLGGGRSIGRSLVVGSRSERPLIALYGHLDTVPEQGNLPASVTDGRVYGLGASDMKAGLGTMIALLEDEEVSDGPYDVMAVFYDGEEGPFANNGLEGVLDAVPELAEAELSIVLEPTDGQLQLGCMGVINAIVEFRGASAHSARPWLGENAITKAAEWLGHIRTREAKEVEVGGFTFYETFVVTAAQGGIARNVIPDSFRVTLNHRFPPDRDLAKAEAELRAVCEAADAVEIVDGASAATIPVGNAHLDRLRGLVGDVAAKTAWTDVARLSERGLAAVNYGPGEVATAHRPDESVPVSMLEESFRVMKAFLTT